MLGGNLGRGAGTGVVGVAIVAAGAGVHSGDEHEAGRVGGVLVGAGEGDLAIF